MVHGNFPEHTIILSKNAEKFLETLDQEPKLRILEKIRELKTNSANLDIKKLQSHHDLYRLRVGHFRIVYTFEHERVTIYIVAIGNRGDIYQHLNAA